MSFAFCWKAAPPTPARHHGTSSHTISPSSSHSSSTSRDLLIVREPDEVRAHLANQPHLFAHLLVGHRRGIARVVGVAMRTAQQHALAVQLERPMLDELEVRMPKRSVAELLAPSAVSVTLHA